MGLPKGTDRRSATIVLLGGDGIGPEVVMAGRTVLEAVARLWGRSFKLVEGLIGGVAMEATGQPLPPATLKACRAAHAVLLGAVGGPRWDDPSAKVRPEQGLLGLRRGLSLFANIRPVRAIPEIGHASPIKPEVLRGTDLVVVRELTGGVYFGKKTRSGSRASERASDLCVYTTARDCPGHPGRGRAGTAPAKAAPFGGQSQYHGNVTPMAAGSDPGHGT